MRALEFVGGTDKNFGGRGLGKADDQHVGLPHALGEGDTYLALHGHVSFLSLVWPGDGRRSQAIPVVTR
jgi:hypothetical protein